MAKKRTAGRTRPQSFKYATPVGVPTSATPVRPGATAPKPPDPYAQRDFSYVGRDVRRILALGGSLVVVQLVLWYLFGHTGLGSAVYDFIQL